VAAVQSGRFRPYVYPVFTPAGHLVTQIAPADHLHHLSIWMAHDHVNGVNFWAPETRAIVPTPKITLTETATQLGSQGVEFRQRLAWVNGDGGTELQEIRTTTVRARPDGSVIDLACELRAFDRPVVLGQTKEAGIAVRVADQIDVLDGGTIVDARGRRNEAETFDACADWVDYYGPVTGAAVAGLAFFPWPEFAGMPWFTRGYGPVTLNPWRQQAREIPAGGSFTLGARLVAHDGTCAEAGVAELYQRFRE